MKKSFCCLMIFALAALGLQADDVPVAESSTSLENTITSLSKVVETLDNQVQQTNKKIDDLISTVGKQIESLKKDQASSSPNNAGNT